MEHKELTNISHVVHYSLKKGVTCVFLVSFHNALLDRLVYMSVKMHVSTIKFEIGTNLIQHKGLDCKCMDCKGMDCNGLDCKGLDSKCLDCKSLDCISWTVKAWTVNTWTV